MPGTHPETGELLGGVVQTYLLEKSRVISFSEQARDSAALAWRMQAPLPPPRLAHTRASPAAAASPARCHIKAALPGLV